MSIRTGPNWPDPLAITLTYSSRNFCWHKAELSERERMSSVVCVTGGSGFIGSWLVRLLLDRGYAVHATVMHLGQWYYCSLPPPFYYPTVLYSRSYRWLWRSILVIYSSGDEAETAHLRALEGAAERLHLFEIDLLDPASLLAAIRGSAGVFHLASPCTVNRVHDPQVDATSALQIPPPRSFSQPFQPLPIDLFTSFPLRTDGITGSGREGDA